MASDNNGDVVQHLARDKRVVYIRVIFLKLGEIDTVKEQYTADVFVQARWHEPALDSQTNWGGENADWSLYWNPKILIENTLDVSKHTLWMDFKRGSNGEGFAIEKRRVKATFFENLELKEFPFDVQDLSLVISSELSADDIELVEDDKDLSLISVQSFVDEQEWTLFDYVESVETLMSHDYINSNYKQPALIVSCGVSRKPTYFIWNIFFVQALICSLCLASFGVSNVNVGNRLQLSFTLVLTAIAFKFVANQSLPKVPYLTYMDIYVLASMVNLYLVCAWHAVVTRFLYDTALANSLDLWAFVIFIIIFIVFHFIFILVIYVKRFERRRGIAEKEQVYQGKVKALPRHANVLSGIRIQKKLRRGNTRIGLV